MKINRFYIILGMLIAFAAFFELAAHADERNEFTRVTFGEPIQIPGQVLPAGTYILEQAQPNNDVNLIHVFNADHTALYATLETVSADRAEATGDTAITLAEPQSGTPALVKWFYPGRLEGHEFVYSKGQEQQIAQAKQETLGNEPKSSRRVAGE